MKVPLSEAVFTPARWSCSRLSYRNQSVQAATLLLLFSISVAPHTAGQEKKREAFGFIRGKTGMCEREKGKENVA